MKAQIDTVQIKTYSLRELDHETMRILDAACASLTDAIDSGRMRIINRAKLDSIYQLILDITSGKYGKEATERSGR